MTEELLEPLLLREAAMLQVVQVVQVVQAVQLAQLERAEQSEQLLVHPRHREGFLCERELRAKAEGLREPPRVQEVVVAQVTPAGAPYQAMICG